MTLGEIINALERVDPATPVAHGFHNPHSYRGYYHDLGVEPKADTTTGEMLACLRSALGATYEGWKGGDYTMNEHVDVYLATEGDIGEEIGPSLLGYMIFGSPIRAGG